MNKSSNQRFDEPAVDGPDYVALVIEWEGPVDAIEDQVTTRNVAPGRLHRLADKLHVNEIVDKLHLQPVVDKLQPVVAKLSGADVAKALGAAGAIVFVGWGIHRLRAA